MPGLEAQVALVEKELADEVFFGLLRPPLQGRRASIILVPKDGVFEPDDIEAKWMAFDEVCKVIKIVDE